MSFLLAAALAPVLHYLRTNSDGSEAERVVVYAEGPDSVRVFKGREACTNAAYVTARLDESGQAASLVGGRLTRELEQERFAWLSESEGRAQVRLGSPDSDPLLDVPVGPRWFLYDFDFADWVARPPAEILERRDLAIEMVLLLVGDDGAPTLTNRGTFSLTYAGSGTTEAGEFLYYRTGGPALAGAEGGMWFDAADGRLLAARLPLANHAEYADFAYSLVERASGESAWREVLANHWRDCPAG